jgi:hypothetical protein
MRAFWMLVLLAAGATARAQQDDEAALALADRAEEQPSTQRACIEYTELAATDTTYSDGTASSPGGRASFNIRCDAPLGTAWRAVFSDRVDDFFERGGSATLINTLKEAYISWRDAGTELIDLGRVNVREGVGFAYNPTDYFRTDAVRAVISIDPNTLRDERLGTLMARSQTLWSSGSLTAIFAPKVDAEPTDSSLSPDFGATNARSRWLLVLSQRIADGLQPQFSLTAAEHQSPQAGLNLTYLVNRATVAYVEWSGGRAPSNLALSGYGPPISSSTSFASRLSTGATYTTSFKLSVTLEYEYDGAAPDDDEWMALRFGPLAPYVQYREYAAGQEELAARQNFFAYAHWDDVVVPHFGLTAFVRFDPFDHSRVTWAEARYYWEHVDVALQWQRNAGDATSDLAPWPKRQSWLALVGYYF